jgi:hypothetical protein
VKQQVQSARSLARSISGMALGAPTKTTSQQAKPPEKGVFPLDHFDECKEEKATCVRQRALSQPFAASLRSSLSSLSSCRRYMRCVSASSGQDGIVVSEQCSGEARKYLECRMRKGLMVAQQLDGLGLPDDKRSRTH